MADACLILNYCKTAKGFRRPRHLSRGGGGEGASEGNHANPGRTFASLTRNAHGLPYACPTHNSSNTHTTTEDDSLGSASLCRKTQAVNTRTQLNSRRDNYTMAPPAMPRLEHLYNATKHQK